LKISAILLAAGLSRRMGRDKLLLEYDGRSFFRRAVDLLSILPVYERIIVISGRQQDFLSFSPGVRVCINSNPENGLSDSVKLGVEAAAGTHYLFLNADQPRLTLNDLMPLIKAAEENPDKIIYPVVDSKPVTPTLFPCRFKQELLSLSGDAGGRSIREMYKDLNLTLKPENPENFKDFDTEEDLFNDK